MALRPPQPSFPHGCVAWKWLVAQEDPRIKSWVETRKQWLHVIKEAGVTILEPNPKPDPPCGLQFCLIGKLVLRVTHKDGGQNTGVHQDAFLQSWANKGHKPDWMWR